MQSSTDLLQVKDIRKSFASGQGLLRRLAGGKASSVTVLDGISFDIQRGQTFGLVGESGCGKSTLARVVAGLMAPDSGQISLMARDGTPPRLQMIFQDPYSSLNSRWTIGAIIAEPIKAHKLRSGAGIAARVHELLEHVGLSAADAQKYPHEFSGGQRQRISIARALAGEPSFLICDEPTSALDVSVQAQILNLLKDLQEELDLTYLFITHNLSVVRMMAHQIGVMYLGQMVEIADSVTLFQAPKHPYTAQLLRAAPDLDARDRSLYPISGEMPSLTRLPTGCRFHNRCPRAMEDCHASVPRLVENQQSQVRCFHPN